MKRLNITATLVLLTSPVLGQQIADCVNPTSDLGVEFYAQGGVVVDGITYFASDDGGCVRTGIRSPGLHSVVAFDVHTLRKVRTYHFGQTYDSSPFLFQKQDGTWLVIAREHKNQRTVAFQRDSGQLEWTSADNQPGNYFFGYSSYRLDDGKYLLLTATSGAPRWAGTDEKYLGIFEAPTPWGPWHTVKQIHALGGEENRFQPRIPPKWISQHGKTFYLLYSCFPEGPYQFNVQKCSLELSEE